MVVQPHYYLVHLTTHFMDFFYWFYMVHTRDPQQIYTEIGYLCFFIFSLLFQRASSIIII